MEAEHPIPQEVSTYQFKLVGDMTIQQFFQVAGGALVSLLIYSTNMAGYVKWPLIIISFLIGIAFAFFPIEDRPLSKWLVLFIKAIYSPTVYVWNKSAVRHNFFAPENDTQFATNNQTPTTGASTNTTPVVQNTVTNSNETTQAEEQKLEEKEKIFLSQVNQQFSSQKNENLIRTTPTIISNQASTQTVDVRQEVVVPKEQVVKVNQKSVTDQQPSRDIFVSQSKIGNQVTPITGQNLGSAQAATYSPEAAPPSPPTRPNVIVGQVLDTTGKIIDGAILEIKDTEGRSARALRTNRLGHFMIVTPLTNGQYQVVTEKEGFYFEPVSVNLEGRVIPPIAISGKKVSV